MGSLLRFVVGAVKSFNTIKVVLFHYIHKGKGHLHTADRATTFLIKSLDTFFDCIGAFHFAHGVYTLFKLNKTYDNGNDVLFIYYSISTQPFTNVAHAKRGTKSGIKIIQ